MMRQPTAFNWMKMVAATALVAGLAVGAPALGQEETLRLPGLTGGALSERELDSGQSVLVFFAGWSPRCRDVVERTNAIENAWGRRSRVALINFQESRAAVQTFVGRGAAPRAPVYLDADGAFSKKHSVTHLPYVLIFRDGEVKGRGRLDDRADAMIRQALRE